MIRLRLSLALILSMAASALVAQAVDPREQSYQFFVDGALTPGIIGYQVGFNHSTVSRTDSRHLDTAFSADQRLLAVNVTQKGLNRLMDWINGATDTGMPVSKAVALVVRQTDGTVLVRWDFTGVTPTTVASQAQGQTSEVPATVSFIFDTMKLTQAKPD